MRGPVRLLAAVSLWLCAMGAAVPAGAAPGRVVSMNLCTDQLAMMIAAPGQLVSVSWLAADPETSALAAAAQDLPANHGLAEEIVLMRPDLVLAGTYTARSTVELLRRLGVRVEEFAPESSLDDIRANITRIGAVLGRTERAQALLAAFDSALALHEASGPTAVTAAAYYANSYAAGSGTLVDALIRAAGMQNVAATLGYAGTARLPLEVLLLAAPEVLVDTEQRQPGPALADQNFTHPAFRRLAAAGIQVRVPTGYTVCGGPFTAEALKLLRDAARRAGAAR